MLTMMAQASLSMKLKPFLSHLSHFPPTKLLENMLVLGLLLRRQSSNYTEVIFSSSDHNCLGEQDLLSVYRMKINIRASMESDKTCYNSEVKFTPKNHL